MNSWIEEIIEAGEGYHIEFKESFDKFHRLSQTLNDSINEVE